MKIIILSTILLFCILPVANANNGNIKIKFIRELVTSSSKSLSIDQEQSLSGFGVEFYQNLIQDSGWVVNQVKSNKEKRLEEQLAKFQNNQLEFPTKSRSKRIKDLEKRLEIEIEKRNLRPLIKNEINDKKESVGLILETRLLSGEITNAASSDIINVRKSVIEIGIRIDW
jgi:hypothetical protein